MSAEMTRSTRGAGSWLRWSVTALFGLLFAFAIWQAVYMFTQGAGGNGLSGLGVVVLLLPIVFPAVAYLAAVLFGRRQRVWRQAVLFAVALALTAVFWLNIVMVQLLLGDALIGA